MQDGFSATAGFSRREKGTEGYAAALVCPRNSPRWKVRDFASQTPDQTPGPKTQGSGENGEAGKPRLRRQSRAFRKDTADMGRRDESKDQASRNDVGFHRDCFIAGQT